MFMLHRKTGAVREAPWIVLRASNGAPYFVNIWTRASRWIPPLGWMDGWVVRSYSPAIIRWANPDAMREALRTTRFQFAWRGTGVFEPKDGLTKLGLAMRVCVEGGAPFLYELRQGTPQWEADEFDSPVSYPMTVTAAEAYPLLQR